jgi:hypothetical protein
MLKGMVVSGGFGALLVREKNDQALELGELLVAETKAGTILLHVFDLVYGSQLSQQHLELVSGLKLEEDESLSLMDPHLRTYVLAKAKGLVLINGQNAIACKSLPAMFSAVRQIEAKDVSFLTTPATPLFVGQLRSGSKVLDVPIHLQGSEVLSHHVLVSATTGKGKSNLAFCMLWDLCGRDYAGVLVLDPHDEYYGRTRAGLKDHPNKEKVVYYSPDPVPGGRTLKVNLGLVQPHHFDGVVPWSDAQRECVMAYWKRYQQDWIKMIFMGDLLPGFQDGTLAVVRRRLQQILDVKAAGDALETTGVFDTHAGTTIIADIVKDLEAGKIVIVDTSSFAGQVELLIGSLVATEALNKYKYHKQQGVLKDKPVISIVLEEAPRVLGKDALERGANIFSTIAREGRKFKVGLIAITQLPSLIPRDILANMNTKIILGTEMKPERQALIESAAQDLAEDDRTIASLDKGEALITSTFVKFATPIKIPLFEDIAKTAPTGKSIKKDFGLLKR